MGVNRPTIAIEMPWQRQRAGGTFIALLSVVALLAIQRRAVRARENPNARMSPSG
jgi:hypothetical protein